MKRNELSALENVSVRLDDLLWETDFKDPSNIEAIKNELKKIKGRIDTILMDNQ